MYKELDYTLTLSGAAETKEGAFNKVFAQIKPQIAREINELVVRIEPKDLEVLSAEEICYTERFMGLFFPRTRRRYEVQVRLTVRLGLVELSKLQFVEKNESESLLRKVLRLS